MTRIARMLTAAVLLTTSACAAGGTPPDPAGQRPTAPIMPSWESCDAAGVPVAAGKPANAVPPGVDQAGLPLLPPDFAPVAVTICGAPDLRPAAVFAEQRTDDPAAVATLTSALRLPEIPRAGECPAWGVTLPWFALHDASGRWVRPGTPLDDCGRPRIETRDALAALPLTPISPPR